MPVAAELLTARGASDDTRELLHSAVKTRLDARAKAGLISTKKKDKRHDATPISKDMQKQYAVFAAKLAQSVIKTYAAVVVSQGTTEVDKKNSTLMRTSENMERNELMLIIYVCVMLMWICRSGHSRCAGCGCCSALHRVLV
jgi:hypothetical protein